MKTAKWIFFGILFLVFANVARAQDYEYGKPAEMKGMTKIFIDTDLDTEAREAIIAEIKKAKLTQIEFLDREEGAQLYIVFKAGKSERFGTYKGSGGTYERSTGKGIVAIPLSPTRSRVLLSMNDSKETWFDKKPTLKFAQAFVKAYKAANDLR